MAKTNITQYDSTPSNNADINSINIAENCPASNINNAIRELMAHLKNMDTGSQALTALSVAGNVTASTSLKTPLIEFTDGDDALTIADGGNVTANADFTVSGAFTSQGIDDNADATAITIDANENVGVNNTNPDQFVTTSKVVAIQGTANNSGSASLHLNGNADGAGYYNTQVFAISGITSATEITRYTGTGNNGFRAYFKIIATGHTAGVNNGINIKEYYYDGDTNAPVQISSYVATNAPVIAFNNATEDMLIVTLSSSNGTSEFRGVLKIEAMIPVDFTTPQSTYTIS